VSLSTNGFSLADVADRLVEMGVRGVVVSIDGREAIHNSMRRQPEAYGWAVEGVKAVLEARKARDSQFPTVTVGFTMTRQNYRDVSDFYAFAQALGVDVVQYIGLIYMSEATVRRHGEVMQRAFGLVPEGMHVLYDRGASDLDAAALQREMDRLRASVPTRPALEFWSAGVENHLEAHYGPDDVLPLPNQRCRSVWNSLVIQPNGDVTACPFLLEVVVGNVLEQDLGAIWNSDIFKRFRKRIRTGLLPGCTRCTWAEYR
jgi:radical SAM protein with 4Fe4S-binding SPASM domain